MPSLMHDAWCRVLLSRAFSCLFAPTVQPEVSPGHRPGIRTSSRRTALKGRDNATSAQRFDRPVRAREMIAALRLQGRCPWLSYHAPLGLPTQPPRRLSPRSQRSLRYVLFLPPFHPIHCLSPCILRVLRVSVVSVFRRAPWSDRSSERESHAPALSAIRLDGPPTARPRE